MEYSLYLESGPRMKTTMVHVPELLGCVANGPTTESALEAAADEIRHYLRFLARHDEEADPNAAFETATRRPVSRSTSSRWPARSCLSTCAACVGWAKTWRQLPAD